jgi:organic hydroperoxide reductase OsmC/OhrA
LGKHVAVVEWNCDGDFAAGKYSRAHRWYFDGGAEVNASSSPSVVPLPFADPAGVDPEEALVASVSACHMLWFLHQAKDAGFIVSSYRDEAEATLGKDERGELAIMKIALRPDIAFIGREPEPAALERLHHEAHEKCFIANSLRSEIVVEASGGGAA